jgi:uncharacterized protein (TIGR03067 family)
VAAAGDGKDEPVTFLRRRRPGMFTRASVGSVLVFMAIGLAVAAPADETKDEAVKKEMAKFEGTWVLVYFKFGEEDVKEEDLKFTGAKFKGERMTFLFKGKEGEKRTFKVDPSKKPAEIDQIREMAPAKGGVNKGIYKFEEDKLTIFLADIGKDRPTEFETKKVSGYLFVYKKQKP